MVAPSRALLGIRDSGGLIPPPSLSTGFGIPGSYVYDATTARQIPAVSRAIQLYGGMTKQMEMDAYRAGLKLPRPLLLDSPDPSPLWPRSRFVMCSVEDYLLSGNTVSLVTSRGADGWPLSVMYLPINWVYITWMAGDPNNVMYTYLGKQLPNEDVIHVARGIDRWYPVRGVGVVEENFPTLDRAAMEGEYERSALAGGAVPSVAVIAPQASSLLGLVSVVAPVVVSGNTAVVVASERRPLPAVSLSEVLATSDVPGGVVNVLTGSVGELAPVLAAHLDVNAIDGTGVVDRALAASLEVEAAENVKRVVPAQPVESDWTAAPDPRRILAFCETKTVWHPIGV